MQLLAAGLKSSCIDAIEIARLYCIIFVLPWQPWSISVLFENESCNLGVNSHIQTLEVKLQHQPLIFYQHYLPTQVCMYTLYSTGNHQSPLIYAQCITSACFVPDFQSTGSREHFEEDYNSLGCTLACFISLVSSKFSGFKWYHPLAPPALGFLGFLPTFERCRFYKDFFVEFPPIALRHIVVYCKH